MIIRRINILDMFDTVIGKAITIQIPLRTLEKDKKKKNLIEQLNQVFFKTPKLRVFKEIDIYFPESSQKRG